MTLIIRSLQTILRNLFKSESKSIKETFCESYRVWPIDIDIFRHMNNAKYLNYMEAARWGMILRCGFLKLAYKRGWIFPIRSVHIEYYRELKIFHRFTIQTQFVRCDEKWFYILQRFYANDKEMARGLVTGTVRRGRENIPPSVYLAELGLEDTTIAVPNGLEEWISGLTVRA